MFKLLAILCIVTFSFASNNVLQNAIDNAPEGSILKLPAGVYKGKIVINKLYQLLEARKVKLLLMVKVKEL